MMRCAWLACASSGTALAQPATPAKAAFDAAPVVAITTAPAPSPTAAPRPYPPPPAHAPPVHAPESSAPAADPPQRSDRFFVAMGALVGGGGPSDWLYGAYHVEAGATISRAPVRTRARVFGVLVGGTIESDWSGDFSRLGAGLEARACTSGLGACAFADLDLGYQTLTLDDHDGQFVRSDKGVFVGPRFGLDAGAAIRVRFAVETYRMFATHTSTTGTRDRSFGTFALSLGVGYQL